MGEGRAGNEKFGDVKILKPKQMARWDHLTMDRYGISGRTLMGRAAQACLDVMRERDPRCAQKPIVILCGPGNNGGDGFALASLLEKGPTPVQCYFVGDPEKYSPEAKHFFSILKHPPIPLKSGAAKKVLPAAMKKAHWVVDALFGTGLSRKVSGEVAAWIRKANKCSALKLAVDMPSGISGETGDVLGEAFRADVTVTFEVPKWGQVQRSAWDYVGDLEVRSIGLVKQAAKKFSAEGNWLDANTVRPFLAKRPKDMNKGKAGAALVVAGSPRMPGAGALCGLGALRSGAGLVTWALPERVQKRIAIKIPELILHFLPSDDEGFLPMAAGEIRKLGKKFQAMALGPGWGVTAHNQELLSSLLALRGIPKVLDADALNILSESPALMKKIRGCLLTPHPKEMSRLVGLSVAEVLKRRVEIAKAFARKYGVYLILKSYRSVAANPKGEIWINSVGGPNLAVAGSGDVLTGILVGLLAQGLKPQAAMLTGLYLHGRAGDRLAGRLGDRGTLASEVAGEVPRVIKELW